MRKLLICALALGGFAASAQAADLSVDSLKDPLPEKLSYAGVTLYGTIDVGYAYQTAGLPESSYFYTGQNYLINSSAKTRAISTLTNNAMSQSQIGVKIEENLGMGFVAIGKIDTGFNPLSGELADACQSLIQSKAVQGGNVVANGDGSRCGQALNGQAYGGLSNSTYGTLTIGRQNAFMTDGVGTYDPNHGSYAFSLIGFSGGAAAGIGSTETGRWDNAIKYLYQFGPVHAGVMYSNGGDATSIQNDAVGGNVGATYKGFSLDAYYTKENGAVNSSGTLVRSGFALPTVDTTPGNTNNVVPFLKGVITNNEAFSIMGKYTYDLGGGFKDEGDSAKVTIFGGYVHTDMATDDNQDQYNGNHTGGGYQIWANNANRWGSDKVLQTAWIGATYATGPWAFTGAYYHQSQDFYQATFGANAASCSNASAANCAGDTNFGSFVVDYTFNKHFDVYAGVSYSEVSGGMSSGYTHTDTTNAVTGLRLKF